MPGPILSDVNAIVLETLLRRTDSTEETVRDFWRMMLVCFNTPRPSTNYDGVTREERTEPFHAVLRDICRNRSLSYREDEIGNILISNSASPHGVCAKYCFQGHMDVVVSKNDNVVHDFDTQGVDVRITDEGTIKPIKGITLGADNGVAIACGLAVLCNNRSIPLELLITKNEETDFSGACGLDASMISANVMLNLDSEVESAICVGSAGGFEQHFELPLMRSHLDVSTGLGKFSVKVSNLKGGHSGIDIDKEKVNAILALCRILLNSGVRMDSIRGGTSTNGIPRDATCTIAATPDQIQSIHRAFASFKAEVAMIEEGIELEIESLPTVSDDWRPFEVQSTRTLLALVFAIGNGVVRKVPSTGDVEASFNLGMIATAGDCVVLKYLVRSTSVSWMQYFAKQLTAIGELAGAKVAEFQGYFGAWEPDYSSNIVEKLIASHPGKGAPKAYTVHAGLECSTILEKFASIGRTTVECASIGPQIEHAHSPDECLFIESAVSFVRWVEALVRMD